MGVSNLNSGPHACKTGTSLTEPSPAATLSILYAPLHLTCSDFHELGIWSPDYMNESTRFGYVSVIPVILIS